MGYLLFCKYTNIFLYAYCYYRFFKKNDGVLAFFVVGGVVLPGWHAILACLGSNIADGYARVFPLYWRSTEAPIWHWIKGYFSA